MVTISEEAIERIREAQVDVEPFIVNMIKDSDEYSCPYKVIREDNMDPKETKTAIIKFTRMLYQHNLMNKLSLSLSNEGAYDTLLYAFGYWGGTTLFKHGNKICKCRNKCY